jgi:hypothetical protein
MSHRENILARLRRWKSGGARRVVGLVVAAYLSAGLAPCAAAPSQALDGTAAAAREQSDVAHGGHVQHRQHAHHDAGGHVQHAQHDAGGHSQHGHADGGMPAVHDTSPAPAEHGGDHCPHCPAALDGAAAIAHGSDHTSCGALEDLANAAASHAKDAPQPSAPPIGFAPFTLPPPLASPLAALPLPAAMRASSIPLNVRHCVFLI